MGVLTSKQYEQVKKEKEAKNLQVKTATLVEKPEVAVKLEPTKEYRLFYPEMLQHVPSNFETKVSIDGKEYKYECIRNLIKTTEKILADYLVLKGYGILEVKDI